MKEFEVHIDYTISGYVYIKARNAKEAEKLAKDKALNGNIDTRFFYPLNAVVVEGDTEETEEA